MPHLGEGLLHRQQHLLLRAALEHLGDEAAAFGEYLQGEVERQFRQGDDAQMVGGGVTGRVRCHVGEHEVGRTAHQRAQPRGKLRVVEVVLDDTGARDRLDRQQVDPDHPGGSALHRNLCPAAGCGS